MSQTCQDLRMGRSAGVAMYTTPVEEAVAAVGGRSFAVPVMVEALASYTDSVVHSAEVGLVKAGSIANSDMTVVVVAELGMSCTAKRRPLDRTAEEEYSAIEPVEM